jgi:RNA polymerase sigma factor (TIGR02999 family)
MEPGADLTQMLSAWRNGDQDAGQQLFEATYQELRRLAAWHLRQERPGHTLQPTALVNELYLHLFPGEPVDWQSRAHFFAVAAQQMRRLLIDHARARYADKRGGRRIRLSITEIEGLGAPAPEDLLALDQALGRLESLDPRAARVVELRFFGGLTEAETSEALGVSVATMKRDWTFARAWLINELRHYTAHTAESTPRPRSSHDGPD